MTEERATYDAGTPGPIDPRDARAVTLAYADGMQAAYDSGERDIVQMRYAGLQAVARAVCPEHHAVYDTRMHVAVPAELVRTILSLVQSLLPTDESEATS